MTSSLLRLTGHYRAWEPLGVLSHLECRAVGRPGRCSVLKSSADEAARQSKGGLRGLRNPCCRRVLHRRRHLLIFGFFSFICVKTLQNFAIHAFHLYTVHACFYFYFLIVSPSVYIYLYLKLLQIVLFSCSILYRTPYHCQ